MSDFTCRNGHAVSIKDKFCPICGLPIKYEDRKEKPRTYEEYVRDWERKEAELRKTMESRVPSRLELGKKL